MNKIASRTIDWLILIAYVGLIYGTLPAMPKVSAFFSSLLGRYFRFTSNAALIAIILVTFVIILKHRPRSRNLLLFYIAMASVFIAYLMLLLFALPIVAEKMHLLEYGFLGYLALRAVRGLRPVWKRYACAFFMIALVGYCDELIQKFTPGRYYELRDVVLNIISGILGLLIIKLCSTERA